MSEPWLEGAVSVNRGGATATPKSEEKEAPSIAAYLANQLARGVYQGAGAIPDVFPRLYGLGKAAIGTTAAAAGRPDLAPEVGDVSPVTNFLLERFTRPGMEAPGMISRLAGGAAEGLGAGVAGGPGMAVLPQALLGAAGGAGAEAGGMMTGDSFLGRLAGGLIGGVAAPALVQGRVAAVKNLAGTSASTAKTNAAPMVQGMVNRQIEDAVSGAPGAAENITRGLALRQEIPGFNPSVAEMANAPGMLDMQRRYAMTTPQNLNAEVSRVQSNLKSIRDYYDKIVGKAQSPGSVRSAVNQDIADESSRLAGSGKQVAGNLPKADLTAAGEKLTDLAVAEKRAATPGIRKAYDDAFDAAGDARINLTPIVDKVEEILGTKLSQVKPESAPQTARKIRELVKQAGDKTPEESAYLASRLGGDIGEQTSATRSQVTLRDMDGIRKAINADIASAGASMNPMAATQLRNLGQVHKTIDETISASQIPQNAKDLYSAAITKYREEFAPRFKEGANLRVFKETSQNEPRILPDKFVSEFFKPDAQAGGTRAGQFAALFGNNAEAKELAKTGILDIYRQRAVDPNTGQISQAAHNQFLRDHGRTLQAYKDRGVNAADEISRIGTEASKISAASEKLTALGKSLKYDTVDDLASAALKSPKVMGNTLMRLDADGRQTLSRLLLDKAWATGDAAGMRKFLGDNQNTLRMAVPRQHLKSLSDIADALEVTERTPLRGQLQAGGPDVLKNATGVSIATVWAQYRATTGGRQGAATAMFNLAAPAMTKLSQTAFQDIMEQALHDPQTAVNLRNLLLSQSPQQAASWATKLANSVKSGGQLLWSAKGPILKYAVGTPNYLPNLGRSSPAIMATTTEDRP